MNNKVKYAVKFWTRWIFAVFSFYISFALVIFVELLLGYISVKTNFELGAINTGDKFNFLLFASIPTVVITFLIAPKYKLLTANVVWLFWYVKGVIDPSLHDQMLLHRGVYPGIGDPCIFVTNHSCEQYLLLEDLKMLIPLLLGILISLLVYRIYNKKPN